MAYMGLMVQGVRSLGFREPWQAPSVCVSVSGQVDDKCKRRALLIHELLTIFDLRRQKTTSTGKKTHGPFANTSYSLKGCSSLSHATSTCLCQAD
jgi:hypothetical protein